MSFQNGTFFINFFYSSLRIMFTDVLQNSLKDLSEIEIGWLEQLAPHFYEFGTVCH